MPFDYELCEKAFLVLGYGKGISGYIEYSLQESKEIMRKPRFSCIDKIQAHKRKSNLYN